MSYTVVASLKKTGVIMKGYVFDIRTPPEAVAAFCAQKKIVQDDLADALVFLGMTGSVALHRSEGVSRDFVEPTRDELVAAYALLGLRGDKGPIDVVIAKPNAKTVDLISRAVTFFTGSLAEITSAGPGKIRVTAAGYHAAIGS
jgi:hypothetical protein